MPTTCLRVRQAWGSDLMIANVRISHQHSHPFPGIQVWAWVSCECPELLPLCWPPNSWHRSQEPKSLECQRWQHPDDVLLRNLCFRVQAWLRKVEPKCHFQLFAMRDFPDGVTRLPDREGFSSRLPMFEGCVHPAPHWTPKLNVLSPTAGCSEDPQDSLDSGSAYS